MSASTLRLSVEAAEQAAARAAKLGAGYTQYQADTVLIAAFVRDGLPNRAAHLLVRHGYRTKAAARRASDLHLLSCRNLGPRLLEAIRTWTGDAPPPGRAPGEHPWWLVP